jgi:hypothetical protein
MILKTLNSRIKYRIRRSKRSVFVPGDFFDLSDRDQVGRVLRQLVNSKELVKIGLGLYAKTRLSSINGEIIPEKSITELGREALKRIGVSVVPTSFERDYNSGKSTQVPTGRVIGVKERISRKIGYDGKFIAFEHVT